MTDARQDWEERIYQRTAAAEAEVWRPAAAPAQVRATSGVGHVTLAWEPVAGASGYLIRRAESPTEQWIELDHGNSDVRPVVAPPYCDADVRPSVIYRYTVAAVGAVDHPAGRSRSRLRVRRCREWPRH